MLVTIRETRTQQPPGLATLLAGGFRPLFLFAGVYAALSIAGWALIYGGWWSLSTAWDTVHLHGHEMVNGFGLAAIGGFMLTAVPKWTSTPPVAGRSLGLIAGAWLLGRIAMFLTLVLPWWVVAGLDLVYPCLLVGAACVPIVRTRNVRNLAFPLLLGAIVVGNALSHLEAHGWIPARALGVRVAVFTIVVMMTLVSGRIVPAFTESSFKRRRTGVAVHPSSIPTPIVLIAVVGSFLAELVGAPATMRGVLSLGTAGLLSVRCAGWRVLHTLRDPIVLVLHVGHAWLILGFALQGIGALTPILPMSAGFHAFTAGAMGTLIVAVASRAALGHTGRELTVSAATVGAYVLVVMGGAGRVFGPLVFPYAATVTISAVSWGLGYAVFVGAYWNVLTRPRVDGAPG